MKWYQIVNIFIVKSLFRDIEEDVLILTRNRELGCEDYIVLE